MSSRSSETDGASKGNPGRAGAGAVLRSEDGRVISRTREGLGYATNNEAEYGGVRLGMEAALREGYKDVTVKTDSKLVAEQLQGHWQTRNENLKELCKEARGLKNEFDGFEIVHVPREFNSDADAQADLATDLNPGEICYERGDDDFGSDEDEQEQDEDEDEDEDEDADEDEDDEEDEDEDEEEDDDEEEEEYEDEVQDDYEDDYVDDYEDDDEDDEDD